MSNILRGYAKRVVADAYGPEPQDIYFSVLLHPRLSRLPRTYIALCGKDTLRDDGTLFAEALQKAG